MKVFELWRTSQLQAVLSDRHMNDAISFLVTSRIVCSRSCLLLADRIHTICLWTLEFMTYHDTRNHASNHSFVVVQWSTLVFKLAGSWYVSHCNRPLTKFQTTWPWSLCVRQPHICMLQTSLWCGLRKRLLDIWRCWPQLWLICILSLPFWKQKLIEIVLLIINLKSYPHILY